MKTKIKRRFPFFWAFYVVLVAALVVCSIKFLDYVKESLSLYEAAQPEHFMDKLVESLKALTAEELAGKMTYPDDIHSRFDDLQAYRIERAQQMLDSGFSWAGGSEVEGSAVYKLLSGGKKAADITIRSVSQEIRLGLMSVPKWELASIVPLKQDTYKYDITYPSAFRLLVNGLELNDGERTGEAPIEGFEYEAEYVTMPSMVSYHIENLLKEPVITVYDNIGSEIPYKMTGNKITVEPEFAVSEFPAELAKEIDVLQLSENWSKFLTRDLPGLKYGIEEARKYFIKGSDFWNMAYSFAIGPDITYANSHYIKSFTNEAVKDYIRYNEDCFSCVVYFEKNMILNGSGAARTDIFNSRLFFVKYDDTDDGIDNPSWMISDMQAVTDNAG